MNNAYRPIASDNTTTVRDFPRRGAHRVVSNGASGRPTPGQARSTMWLTRGKGAGLLAAASCLLLVLAAAQGYVSFRAQYAFVDHAKRAHVPSILEALGLDTGAVIFALLALSLARRGLPGTVERVLNVACALGSPHHEPPRRQPHLTTVSHRLGPAQRAIRARLRPPHRGGPALGPDQRPPMPSSHKKARPGEPSAA
jgi:hypothetical protein